MRLKLLTPLPLLASLLLVTACASAAMFDQMTVTNLATMKGLPDPDVSRCDSFVSYEQGKKDASDKKFDGKSVEHVTQACDCVKTAVGKPSLVKQSCAVSIDAYVAYEDAKKKD